MSERQMRGHQEEHMVNQTDLSRYLQIPSRVRPHGQVPRMEPAELDATNELRLQHTSQESSSNCPPWYHNRTTQLLPNEDVALVIWGNKVTGDIVPVLHFHSSKEAARKYLTLQKRNPWPSERFNKVDWEHLNIALCMVQANVGQQLLKRNKIKSFNWCPKLSSGHCPN